MSSLPERAEPLDFRAFPFQAFPFPVISCPVVPGVLDERRVAEDLPEYSFWSKDVDASDEPSSRPSDEPDPGEALVIASRPSVHPHVAGRIAEGVALRLAAELIDGTRLAAADRAANVARLRRATECVSGAAPEPDTDEGVAQRLKSLARTGDRLIAEQVRLLVRFADAHLYEKDGCRTMAMWMGVHLGLGESTATERLRIGRALKELPVCESFFALGKLTLSQLRHIVRHASAATDFEFAEATTNLSVPATEDYCRRFRHEQDADEDAANADAHGQEASDALAALRAHERRSLTVREIDAHSTRILVTLPTDMAADFLRSLEHAENWIREGGEDDEADALVEGHGTAPGGPGGPGAPKEPGESAMVDSASVPGATVAEKPTACQIRADAAVLVGRRSLAHAGEAVAMADRYRVHVNIDARDLAELPTVLPRADVAVVKTPGVPDIGEAAATAAPINGAAPFADVLAVVPGTAPADVPTMVRAVAPALAPALAPTERPQIQGFGPISRATARRLAARSGFTLHAMDDVGHPVGAMAKAPLFTKRQLRAMRGRDRCCQVPGCGSTRYLEGHHVVHRAHGGRSGIECGAIVCGGCHRLLHEGGFRLERVTVEEVDAELEARNYGIDVDAAIANASMRTGIRRGKVAAKLARVRRYRLIDANGADCANLRSSASRAIQGEGIDVRTSAVFGAHAGTGARADDKAPKR